MKNVFGRQCGGHLFLNALHTRNAYALSWPFEKVQGSIWRTAQNRCPDTADRSSVVGMIGLLDVLPLWYRTLPNRLLSVEYEQTSNSFSCLQKEKKQNKREWIRNVRPRVVNKTQAKHVMNSTLRYFPSRLTRFSMLATSPVVIISSHIFLIPKPMPFIEVTRLVSAC